ncbi:MAG: caspase family protein [Sphingomonas sp.]
MLLLLAALLAVPAAAATRPPAIRGLFVGIDKYLYSGPDNQFNDLRGAVGDVGRIKQALRTAYRLDLDQAAAGSCRSENAVSITLTDQCATRDAILGSLQKQIDASRPGDTLVFYYAGHGSIIADDQVFDQASGVNDTILPTDARKPGAQTDGDILDRELRGYVDEATAKGVNVVTIFDSCDSGTAVRAGPIDNDPGEDRAAPGILAKKLVRPAPPIARGPGGGYRVHLAAAADGQVAREVGTVDNQRAGVFTTALAQTIVAMPNATFGDIMAEVGLRVAEGGRPGQVPQIEGAVSATMGGKERSTPLFDATLRNGEVSLAAGELSGMTTGSTFALFASASDALTEGGAPLTTGAVTAVDATTATLKLDASPLAALPVRLIAREINHAYGNATLAVRIGGDRQVDRAAVAKALAGVSFVRIAEPATFAVDVIMDRKPLAFLTAIDGTQIARLGPADAAGFGDTLRGALQKVMRVQALVALRTTAGATAPGFCIDNDIDYDQRRCPQSGAGKPFALASGAKAKLTVTNTAATPRYLYVYAIDGGYEVNLLLPSGGGKDPPLAPNTSVNVTVQPDRPGRYRFVTIATDAPIGSARALEQSATGARDPGACRSALERLVCEAASGTRDPSVPRVGAWIATVTDVIVAEGKKP